jgi:hypothetical protein
MRYRRWLGLGLALVTVAAAGALGGTRWARSQGSFPKGAFVAGADDTRWVVGNGVRYRMNFITDDGGRLAGLRDAGVVATVSEASAALAAARRPVAVTPVPVEVATPAASLVGQRVTACNYAADLEITVVRTEWVKTVVGETAPGNDMWIVAIIEVTNVSDKAEALTTRPLLLRDGRGQEYNVREDPPGPVELARAYSVHPAFEAFEPGITEQSVVTFQVPDDVGLLTLVGKRDFC